MNVLRRARQEHGRLTRGVRAADDRDLLRPAILRLDEGRAVVHADALVTIEIVEVGLVVADAGRDHDRARPERASIREQNAERLLFADEALDGARDDDVRAELLSL